MPCCDVVHCIIVAVVSLVSIEMDSSTCPRIDFTAFEPTTCSVGELVEYSVELFENVPQPNLYMFPERMEDSFFDGLIRFRPV